MPRAGMLRPERLPLTGKGTGFERAPAAGRGYPRVSPGNLERVSRAHTGCRATQGSAWRQELQAVPASWVSGRVCSKGHIRRVAPPTCWSSGAAAQWRLGRQGRPEVGGGHWGEGNAVCPGAGPAVSAIPAGPCAPDLSRAVPGCLFSCHAAALPATRAVTRPWQSGSPLCYVLGRARRAGRAVSCFPVPPPPPPPLPGVDCRACLLHSPLENLGPSPQLGPCFRHVTFAKGWVGC